MAMGKGFRLSCRIVTDDGSPYGLLLEHRNKPDALMFDSLSQSVAVLSSDETRVVKADYKRITDAYGFLGVLHVNTVDANVLYVVLVTGCVSVGRIGDSEFFRVTSTHFQSFRHNSFDEERIADVRKLLNSGTFYFSWSSVAADPLDLTLCAQRKLKTSETDNRFFWNCMLHSHLLHHGVDCSQWVWKIMCGSIEMRTVYVGHQQAKACIISRLSCERAGTRFNVRGCNDDGHVANFVETEQSIHLGDAVSSYIQIRGSLPLFWEQPGIQVGSHRVKMSRGVDASAPAFDRHLTLVKRRYGKQAIVNLLGSKEGESLLTEMFQNHLKASKRHQDVSYVHFDYHALCRRSKNNDSLLILRTKVAKNLAEFGFFTAFANNVQCEQLGAIRTNCLDCLDRTNCVQTFFGLELLDKQLHSLGIPQQLSRFEEVFRQMWVNNGDQVSKIYAGTGALEGKSKLTDGARSISRTIQNNLLDNSKQEAIDVLLLGNTFSNDLVDRARILLPKNVLHAPNEMLQALCARRREYTRPVPLRVSVATWNVNGGKNLHNVAFKHQPLDEWLLDAPRIARNNSLVDYELRQDDRPADIFAVGFEEIVDLNASNIMSVSTANQEEWRKAIHKCINRDRRYVLVTCQQLVGVCLFVFVRPELVPFLRDVAVDTVKTGLGGAAGNKGAVAIRLLVHCTSLCFVCAHFAAGQSQVTDRNADYAEITKRIAFPMGRRLESHDHVFWMGDFNYRIDLPIEEVKEAVRQHNFKHLLDKDQLNAQRNDKHCFVDFLEGELTFAPTYKYDTFSDDYDTSEKSRIPAWTDRILWKQLDTHERPAKLVFYGRGELKTSDHRPVIAIFDIEARQVNGESRDAVFDDVLHRCGPPNATVVVASESGCIVSYGDDFFNELLAVLGTVGVVTIVRYMADSIWATFSDGRSALSALQLDGTEVLGYRIHVALKMPDWQDAINRELRLACDNTVPLTEPLDDAAEDEGEFPVDAFDDVVDGGCYNDYASSEDGSCYSGKASPVPPNVDDGHTFVAYLGGSPSTPSKVPPPRPAPPQRPPPPQIADVALQRSSHAAEIPVRSERPEPNSSGAPNGSFGGSEDSSSSPPPPSMAPPPLPPSETTTTAACGGEPKHPPPKLPERPSVAAPAVTTPPPPPVPSRSGVAVVAAVLPPVPARTNINRPATSSAAPPPAIPPRRQVIQ